MDDLIRRQAAIDEVFKLCDETDNPHVDAIVYELENLPSAQPEQDREFIKLTVRNSNGRPYYSIIYLEFDDNGVGHDFEGYSSYSLDVISDYLKKYFTPSAQPHTCLDCIHWKEYKAVGRICDFHDWVSRETDYCSLWEEKK